MTDQELQLEVQDIFLTEDSKEAIALISQLKREPVLSVYGQALIPQLQFIRISSLSKDQLLDLLRNNILFAYNIPDYDLAAKIQWYVEQVELVVDQVEISRNIQSVLEGHKTPFSQIKLIIKNQTYPATIGNWITDYNSYPSKEPKKGALDEIEYINKSPNVKQLSPSEKEVIKNLIKLYDYCSNLVAEWNAVPVPRNEAEAFKDFDLYKFIPGLETDEGLSVRTSTPPFSPTITPALAVTQTPSVAPQLPVVKPQERIINQTPKPSHPVILAKDALKISTHDDLHDLVNNQPRQKMGVVLDPTNIKVAEEKKRIENERTSQEALIQKKLAELRKRNNKSQ